MTTIKKLRALPAIALIGALTCWSSMASAGPITVEFEITGPGGFAAFTGSFAGEDSNSNGFIGHFPSYSEVTAFNLDWNGPGSFNHNLDDLVVLL
ncbi:MAG: hypothetical protein ACR2Q3_04310, partial [Woeseiaceae bacterium]